MQIMKFRPNNEGLFTSLRAMTLKRVPIDEGVNRFILFLSLCFFPGHEVVVIIAE